MDLFALSYTSSAVRVLTACDIRHLLSCARATNEREGVTGVLLYAGGTFHQYIEGPAEGLDRVYSVIRRDRLHHDIFELIREPIDRREFPLSPMGFPYPELSGDDSISQLVALIADEAAALPPGRLLLNAFWNKSLHRIWRAPLK